MKYLRYIVEAVFLPALYLLALPLSLASSPHPAFADRADFDGDGKDDLTLFDSRSGNFYVRTSSTQQTKPTFLGSGRIPVIGDFNFPADAKDDFAAFDRTAAYWDFSVSSGFKSGFRFGTPGDFPLAGDWDGDGCDDLAVYNPAAGGFILRLCASGTDQPVNFGAPGEVPVPGDYDNDGLDDLAVFSRAKNSWSIRLAADPLNLQSVQFGLFGDIPVPADYLGDGATDIAVYRPNGNLLIVRRPGQDDLVSQWGLPGDLFSPLDIDGDGKSDRTIFRPSIGSWVALTTSNSYFVVPWIGNGQRSQGQPPLPDAAWLLGGTFGDYNGDRRTDPALVLQSSGKENVWQITPTGRPAFSFGFGLASDTLFAGDTNGDQIAEPIAVRTAADGFRHWLIERPAGGPLDVLWGLPGDSPGLGDFDCDGKDDLIQIRPNGLYLNWYIRGSTGKVLLGDIFGLRGDAAFAADIDGDRCDDLIVARRVGVNLIWFYRTFNSTAVFGPVAWGLSANDTALTPSDFDGDGKADLFVVRGAPAAKIGVARLSGSLAAAVYNLPAGSPDLVGRFGGLLTSDLGTFSASAGSAAGTVSITGNGGSAGNVPVSIPGSGAIVVPPRGGVAFAAAPAAPTGSNASGAGLTAVCARIEPFSTGYLWKPSSDDSGGERQGRPLIIMKKNISRDSCLSVFASNGQEVSRLGVYEFSGNYGGRWYSGYGCGDRKNGSAIVSAARSASGSSEVYIEQSSGTCIGPVVATNRTGSL